MYLEVLNMNRSSGCVEIGDFIFVKNKWLSKDYKSLPNHTHEGKDRPYLVVGFAKDNPNVFLAVPLTHSLHLVIEDLEDAIDCERTSSAAPYAFFCTSYNMRSGRSVDGALLLADSIAVPRLDTCCELAYKSADLQIYPLEPPTGHKYPTKASMQYARNLFSRIKERFPNYIVDRYTVPGSLDALSAHVTHASEMHFTKTNLPRYIKLAENELAKAQQRGRT